MREGRLDAGVERSFRRTRVGVKNNETRRAPSVVVTEVETAAQDQQLPSKLDGVRSDMVDDVRARLMLIEAEALARITRGAQTAEVDADESDATMDAQALADVVAALRSKTRA